jgi:peptidoglycan/xylan/chitin deacetylase (PgdA/CDA1 family)
MGFYDNGVISICFDDSYASHRSIALPAMAGYGFRGTLFPICEAVDQADAGTSSLYCTTSDLQAMQDLGWEVGAHSYAMAAHSGSITAAQLQADLTLNQQWLADRGLRGGDTFAYAVGAFNAGKREAAADQVSSARTILSISQKSETLPPSDMLALRSQSGVASSAGYVLTTTLLNQVKASKNWLILTMHNIAAAESGANVASTATFLQMLADISAAGIPVVPVGEVVEKIRAFSD